MAENKHKVMLINVTHAEESRVAIVSDGVLESFEIETFDHKSRKGDLYKAKVESVHAGLQAAFVDIGDKRAGFLPLDEVNFRIHPARGNGNRNRLESHIHKGQEVLVQVVRDAFANKPPTLSTYFSLPGRYLVLTPFQESKGISRKLDDKVRERLKKIVDSLPLPEGFGVIVRTAGAAGTKQEIQRDLRYLLRLWEKIEQAAKEVKAPALVYKERSLVIRAIRDLFTPDIDEILVDDRGTWEEIVEFFDVVLPQKKKIVKLYQGDRPIFNKYNLEEQIEHIFRRRVPLPSGGALIFDTTEALTAIDVNSGRMRGEGHIEDTALKANVEAAREIARQLRLRDLGGLIVIDFIDMRSAKHVRQVEKAMRDALRRDKARYDVTRISKLGLMEISRERLRPEKSSLRYVDCPVCAGTGSIKTVEAAALQALRRLQTRVVRGDLENIEVVLPPEVAEYVLNQKRHELIGLEERYGTTILVKADPRLLRDDAEIRTVPRKRDETERPLVAPPSSGEILEAMEEVKAEEESAAAGDAGGGEGNGRKKKKRRRRRRKKKTGDAAAEGGSPEHPAGDDAGAAPGEEAGRDAENGRAPSPGSAVAGESPSAPDGAGPAPDTPGGESGREADGPREEAGTGDGPAATGEAAGEETAGGNGERRKKKRRRRRRKKKSNGAGPAGAEGEAPEPGSAPEPVPGEPPLAALPASLPAAEVGADVPRLEWWEELVSRATREEA